MAFPVVRAEYPPHIGLSWVVSLGHGKWSEKTLLRMEHISGAGLLILALIHGGTIMWQMVHHRM